MLPRSLFSTLLLILALGTGGYATAEGITLPDMGDSSATRLSPEQEHRIGVAMLRDIRQSGKLVEDPELNQYIQSLGYRLVSHAATEGQHFTFFLLDDPTINAFAMPGGFVGVHTGLVLATDSEDELAAVLAHEISHVTQHHLARAYDQASRMQLPMTAAVIAAILLGSRDPQAGQAALAAAMAGSAQSQIDTTRANEKEADRVGMGLLYDAGFDPRSMPDFFEKLAKENRYDAGNVPEFLRTHPVTSARIADSLNRANQYPVVHDKDSLGYSLAKARIRVLTTHDMSTLAQRFKQALEKHHGPVPEGAQYGYALILQRQGHYTQAEALLHKLLKENPERIAYLSALGDVQLAAGKDKAALTTYKKSLGLYPDNTVLTLGFGNALLTAGQAQAASDLLYRYTRDARPPAQAYQLLAKAEASLGHQGASHLAQAEYYHAVGEYFSAIDQLHIAKRAKALDFYTASRIDALLQRYEQEASQMPRTP